MKKYILGVLLFVYCNLAGAVTTMVGQTWIFDTLNGAAVDMSKYQAQKPNIVFNSGGRFSAYAGCNRIAGSYSISGKELTFAPNTIMTKMACTGREELESNFIAILPQIKLWSIDGNILTLSSSDETSLITLKSGSSE